MDGYTRYAVYFAPPPGPLAEFGAAWLGRDAESGRNLTHMPVRGLPRPAAELVAAPRKYGFHGTLKPPFRLAEGHEVTGLHTALQALAGQLHRVRIEAGLELAHMGGFVALVPAGPAPELETLAARLVESLDGFRAPLSDAERARREESGLTPAQAALLDRWGYPYVMEAFRFHITLTGRLPEDEAAAVIAALEPHLAGRLPAPFRIDDICLFGEGQDGLFRNLHRYRLTG